MANMEKSDQERVEPSPVIPPTISRFDFPPNFIFGTASSAYQYEGAAFEGGKGWSIWDTLTHDHPEEIIDHSNGDVAVDFYHRYKEDVQRMKEVGMDAFRFSISWPRVLPNGRRGDGDIGVNEEGVRFYRDLIHELRSKDLEPFVTIFHWDLPQALEDEYGGFLSPRIVDDFREFAGLCFEKFGNQVKHWITINEPWSYCITYAKQDTFALMSRCAPLVSVLGRRASKDPSTDPYTVAHHMLLSHGEAVKLYKEINQVTHGGDIGITNVCNWMVPYSDTDNDKKAAARALDFMLGWFMDPLTYGHYPQVMRTLLGGRLPKFTEGESNMVKGSFDFIGMNYYTAHYAADDPSGESGDSHVKITTERDGIPIGPPAASIWLNCYSNGFEDLLVYIKENYQNPTLYITENGIDEFRNDNILPHERAVEDPMRIYYHHLHLLSLKGAIDAREVNVKGYFAWSLLDNFEWRSGYTVRFGLYFVDYNNNNNNNLARLPKNSVGWFQKFLQKILKR